MGSQNTRPADQKQPSDKDTEDNDEKFTNELTGKKEEKESINEQTEEKKEDESTNELIEDESTNELIEDEEEDESTNEQSANQGQGASTVRVKFGAWDTKDPVEVSISGRTTGASLLKKVLKRMAIEAQDASWFGLNYVDKYGLPAWAELDERTVDQLDFGGGQPAFTLAIRYFPPNPLDDLINSEVLAYVFHQNHYNLVNSQRRAGSLDGIFRLAAYAFLAKGGDLRECAPGYLEENELLPKWAFEGKDKARKLELEQRFARSYLVMDGDLKPLQARVEYFRAAQALGLYGETLYEVTDAKANKLEIGIGPYHVRVYTPMTNGEFQMMASYPMERIHASEFECAKLMLIVHDEQQLELTFRAPLLRHNRQILSLIETYHSIDQQE